MKTRRIAARQIGDNTPAKHKATGGISTAFSIAVVAALVALSLALLYVRWTMPPVSEVLRITVLATLALTQTTLPTATSTPTLSPATLTPLPTIHLEHATVLAQVWLYDAPGGERLPAGLLAGQEVTVLESRDGFVKVLWDGEDTAIVGWVAERWISVQQ